MLVNSGSCDGLAVKQQAISRAYIAQTNVA